MRILCVFGQHNYGNPSRGEGYEYTNFIPALRRLGHEVLFLETWNRSCYSSFAELNMKLLNIVEKFQPDIVLSVMFTYEIWLETWNLLRDAGITATVNWTTDDSWKYSQFSRLVAPTFHAFTTTYPDVYDQYIKDGISQVLLTQWASNSLSLRSPIKASSCKYQVSFVGTAHSDRRRWINRLRQRGVDVTCFGYGWPQGSVDSATIPHIIRNSVISLNFSKGASIWQGIRLHQTRQIKARTFEVPGAGGFLLTESAEGLDRYYRPGEEIAVFSSLDDLINQIHYYLEHPDERDEIALAGYRRTSLEHTYDQRLSEVLEFALSQKDRFFECSMKNPVGEINWNRFDEAVRQHKLNVVLFALNYTLVQMCSLVWGPIRGRRAARRLVFELSWRLVGEHTYSAAGWPGRMFFKEI